MRILKSLFRFFLWLGLAGALAGAAGLAAIYLYYSPKLPSVQTLKEIHFQTPLRVYSHDNKLIAEFGEKRRTPIAFEQIPKSFIDALLAAEDSRFYEHHGIDIKGLARAAFQLATTGRIQSGGSTITMQVAKNFFLTRERTFSRKFMEILLALRIEQELSKSEILELYVNKIYLGHRSYGIQAAANVYYGDSIENLTIAQLAMIAGLPKAPSAYNPITNPERAGERRNWILQRMHSLSLIDDQTYYEAKNAPITASYHGSDIELNAPYIAEMVRSELHQKYGDELYTEGFRVYTSIKSDLQKAASDAVRDGLLAYTERHGYFGAQTSHNTENLSKPEIAKLLKSSNSYGNILSAIVIAVQDQSVEIIFESEETASIEWLGLSWARPYISTNSLGPQPKTASEILKVGDQIMVQPREDGWHLTQIPKAQGAMVALNPSNGSIEALIGGFNFHHNKFNRITQALRQPGSNIKPFIYAAALDQGMTPATLINDAPVVFHDDNLEANWRPENYSKKFYGPTRLREALYKSRNLVSIRLLQQMGINHARSFLERFGFDPDKLPHNLSLALGSADLTPMQVVTGYAALANGGFKVQPFLIDRIENAYGELLFQHHPDTLCPNCQEPPNDPSEQPNSNAPYANEPIAKRIISEQTHFLINNMLQDVIKLGTGRKAKVLARNDLAGKTGTTNDQKDAWFSGYNPNIVATAWVGFDQPETLGRKEFGGTAALPIWIDFMKVALEGKPEQALTPPNGIISVKIDPTTGLLAYPGQRDAIFEFFPKSQVPSQSAKPEVRIEQQEINNTPTTTTDEIF